MSEGYKLITFSIKFVSNKIKFLIIMSFSILISALIAVGIVNLPALSIFPMQYDQSIQQNLVNELVNVQRMSFVKIAQHGYDHSINESFRDVMKGYDILKNYSLKVDYYVPPYEVAPTYPVPAELLMIPYESDGTHYSDDTMDYGKSTLNNSTVLAIHVQDDLDMKKLDEMTVGRDFRYLRIDDINTDIVDADVQIKRIYTMVGFCDKRNCTLVIAVIPHVLRLQQSDKSYLFFNKLLMVISVMMMVPIYIFYLMSHKLSRWFE
jgi:hypothetical protein